MSFISFDEFLDRVSLREGSAGNPHPAFFVRDVNPGFVHPTLRLEEDPALPKVELIYARGATGKSILAQQVSGLTRVPLWALQDDKAVSADALSARLTSYLATPNPLSAIRDGSLKGLLIDSLDEARLRVTGQSWTEFIGSLADFAHAGIRLVILGRKRSIEDAWLELGELNISTSILEISHFDRKRQIFYVDRKALNDNPPTSAFSAARDSVLKSLREAYDSTSEDSFVGYAPVLDAVAALVKPPANHQAIINDFAAGSRSRQIVVLGKIINELLLREQTKVEALAKDLQLNPQTTYAPDEQLSWLASQLLGASEPPLSWCPEERREQYMEQIQSFRADHPFVTEQTWASPVFASYVGSDKFFDASEDRLGEIGKASGLLFEFIASQAIDSSLLINESHLAALQNSLIAGQWSGTEATVTVWPDGDLKALDRVKFNLSLFYESNSTRTIQGDVILAKLGTLKLISPLANTAVTFPGSLEVHSGHASSISIGPDVYLHAISISLVGSSLVVPKSIDSDGNALGVEIEAEELFDPGMAKLFPAPREYFTIAVPSHVKIAYPWIEYRTNLVVGDTPVNERARRFLDRLMNIARVHGHGGERAVFVKKLQGRAGLAQRDFQLALTQLEKSGVVRIEGELIFITAEWDKYRYDGKSRPGMPSFEDNRLTWEPVLTSLTAVLASL